MSSTPLLSYQEESEQPPQETYDNLSLTKSLEDNINIFKQIFNNNETIIIRPLSSKQSDIFKGCIIFVDGMVNKELINENIIRPIMDCSVSENISDTLVTKVICCGDIKKVTDINQLVRSVLYGSTLLLVDGAAEVLLIGTQELEQRSISEPSTDKVLRGPREGFTESLTTNLSLIRRRILSANLKFQFKEIGLRTKTKVCICYIEGLASEKILKELNDRLNRIELDGILESGYIEEWIKDSPLSFFKTIGSAERPDVVSGKLLEGRIAIICDGTPIVLTLPFIFIEYFQVGEDYYKNFIYSSINRALRIIGFILSASVPGIFVALTTFHSEMIPSPLLLNILAARDGLPFPTVVEALAMGLIFEILREAGTRMPTAIGQAISIVGALVLGEAAVNAKFISAPMIIVVALTGISAFLIPQMIEPLIIIRFVFVILSAFLGLYGFIFGLIGIFIPLMSMRSFGIPYMLSISPINKQDIQDTIVRAPWWYMHYRPRLIGNRNPVRQASTNRKERK